MRMSYLILIMKQRSQIFQRYKRGFHKIAEIGNNDNTGIRDLTM